MALQLGLPQQTRACSALGRPGRVGWLAAGLQPAAPAAAALARQQARRLEGGLRRLVCRASPEQAQEEGAEEFCLPACECRPAAAAVGLHFREGPEACALPTWPGTGLSTASFHPVQRAPHWPAAS